MNYARIQFRRPSVVRDRKHSTDFWAAKIISEVVLKSPLQ